MADTIASSMGDLSLDPEDPQNILQATIDQGNVLREEIERYISAVDAHQKDDRVPYKVHYNTLRSDLKTELAALDRLVKKPNISKDQASSTNLKYFEALWAACKRSSGLVGFRKYFYWNQRKHHEHLRGRLMDPNRSKDGNKIGNAEGNKAKWTTLVDIVAEGGHEWVRISTATEKRLLHDLAKLGWQNDSDSECDDDEKLDQPNSNNNWEDDDDEDQVFLVKNARDLIRAARANPIAGRPPIVRIVLTRIEEGQIKEVDDVLAKMRATGAIVQCAGDIPPTKPLEEVLPHMLVQLKSTSETLNIDCTILMALISDISHQDCDILDWYPAEVQLQIEEEKDENLLPSQLYPAIGSYPMVCTKDAAEQMNHIVDTLATDTEKTRANILLAQGTHENVPSEALIKEWQDMSKYPIPEGFNLPIRVVECDVEELTKRLPFVAEQVAPILGPSNAAIFFYGWANYLTTLSANRTRAKQIEKCVQEVGLVDGEAPPHIWLCGGPRSLIAKTGRPRRRKGMEDV